MGADEIWLLRNISGWRRLGKGEKRELGWKGDLAEKREAGGRKEEAVLVGLGRWGLRVRLNVMIHEEDISEAAFC